MLYRVLLLENDRFAAYRDGDGHLTCCRARCQLAPVCMNAFRASSLLMCRRPWHGVPREDRPLRCWRIVNRASVSDSSGPWAALPLDSVVRTSRGARPAPGYTTSASPHPVIDIVAMR